MIAEDRKTRYFIDLQWYTQNNRSFQAMAQQRLCPACKAKLGTEVQERVPTVDPKTGRVVFEMRNVPYASNPMTVVRSCCSKERSYVTAETPVAEALFRVFLANSNQPISAEQIREQLSNYISLADRPHGYSPELIERIIANDRFYGLRAFQLGVE
ncbi:MAG: hypothetical protein HYY04_05615 [Chloroflexi bacterium]|nr:hypothetical protein [Chloroflexota bacterium]